MSIKLIEIIFMIKTFDNTFHLLYRLDGLCRLLTQNYVWT